MEDSQLIGAIIGGILGYVISLFMTSGKFTYLGGTTGLFEGSPGFFKGCLINLVFIIIGGAIGLLLGSA